MKEQATARAGRAPAAWSAAEVRRQIRRGTSRHDLRRLDAAGPSARPSEARVLDAADEIATRYLALGGDDPFMVATALLAIEAVAELRTEHGFVAAPADDLTSIPRLIAAQVFDRVEAQVVAAPAMAWAVDLCVQITAREAAEALWAGAARRRPWPRARTFQAMAAQEHQAGTTGDLWPRVAVAVRDAEAQAVVDLRRAVAADGDPREALAQLAAVARARRALPVDRAQLLELVRARVPAC